MEPDANEITPEVLRALVNEGTDALALVGDGDWTPQDSLLRRAIDALAAIAEVGGVVNNFHVVSTVCGERTGSLSCVGPVGHAGNHVAYRGPEVLLWRPSNSYSFECGRGRINV
jgi:hypothetical protein